MKAGCGLRHKGYAAAMCREIEGLRDRIGLDEAFGIEIQGQQILNDSVVEKRVGMSWNPN